eukprot:Sspe_Gene.57898::Locus_31764_Transcript_1_1_Confidence_1.000_Length_587::g.57898::m.57898
MVCADETKPPCAHNNWDDVRQRKGVKMLRCRECNILWKWPRGTRRGGSAIQRCIPFLNGECLVGKDCPLIHVWRRKVLLPDRVKSFGPHVLEGVPPADRKVVGDLLCGTQPPLSPVDDNIGEGVLLVEPELEGFAKALEEYRGTLTGAAGRPTETPLDCVALECARIAL